ncbi:MAG: FAD-dependent oxidoreductase [Alphaproteobacteria bacterium]
MVQHIAILGGGMAGLGAASRAAEHGLDARIYEQRDHLGGHASSFEIDGYTFDEGIHVSFTRNDAVRALFEEGVGGAFHAHEARLLNHFDGHWLRHPVQTNLFGLPARLIEDCLVDIAEAAANFHDCPPTDYGEWLHRNMGRTLAETFPAQYTRKYWTVEPAAMTTDWIGPRVYPPKLREVVHGALGTHDGNHQYLTAFRYPMDGGFAAFYRPLAARVSASLEHEIVAIHPARQRLDFANGVTAHYDALVSTLPLPVLVDLLPDVPTAVREAAARLRCTSLVLVSIGLKHEIELPAAHWVYFYDDEVLASRAWFPQAMSPSSVPAGTSAIQAEIYHSDSRPLPVEDVGNRTVEDFRRMGLIGADDAIDFVDVRHQRWGNVLFDHDRAAAVGLVRAYVEELGIRLAGRYGEWAYYWTDDAMVSGWRAADDIAAAAKVAAHG